MPASQGAGTLNLVGLTAREFTGVWPRAAWSGATSLPHWSRRNQYG
jgi:hypothetical protein